MTVDHQPRSALRRRVRLRAVVRSPAQAGIEAEDDLQLPPRDTAGIEKKAKQAEADRGEARAIREKPVTPNPAAVLDRLDEHHRQVVPAGWRTLAQRRPTVGLLTTCAPCGAGL
jgi:hypothetical protein